MQKLSKCSFLFLMILVFVFAVQAQDKMYSDEEIAKVEKLFKEANELSKQKKPAKALIKYEEAIAIIPDSSGLLYNAGLTSFQTEKFEKASKYWSKLKSLEPNDWQVRAKLVQTYQSLGSLDKRDSERKELFDLRKSGNVLELNKTEFYCREQTILDGRKVMVFEYFELKGDRALRYVFYFLNDEGKPESRISLGSYATTNAVWRETTKPKPKKGDRLFHLDGYYKWGHATYGMYAKEPTYDEVRKIVEGIITKKKKSVSSSTVVRPKKDSENRNKQKKP